MKNENLIECTICKKKKKNIESRKKRWTHVFNTGLRCHDGYESWNETISVLICAKCWNIFTNTIPSINTLSNIAQQSDWWPRRKKV